MNLPLKIFSFAVEGLGFLSVSGLLLTVALLEGVDNPFSLLDGHSDTLEGFSKALRDDFFGKVRLVTVFLYPTHAPVVDVPALLNLCGQTMPTPATGEKTTKGELFLSCRLGPPALLLQEPLDGLKEALRD
ncbi:MAG: hypothetical protein RX316_08340 [bacterium]|nr:hypothetical protein [bacterium]